MKKIMPRILAVLLVSVMVLTVLAGCRRDSDENNGRPGASDDRGSIGNGFVPPEYVFVPEFIDLPETVHEIGHFTYAGGVLYFISTERDTETYYMDVNSLFSMSPDGSNLTKLDNFEPLSAAPAGGDEGFKVIESSYIMTLIADSDGNLWIIENGWAEFFDLPDDFAGEDHEMYEYHVDYTHTMAVRKLDNTGRELLSIDLDSLPGGRDTIQPSAFNIDNAGNLYMA